VLEMRLFLRSTNLAPPLITAGFALGEVSDHQSHEFGQSCGTSPIHAADRYRLTAQQRRLWLRPHGDSRRII